MIKLQDYLYDGHTILTILDQYSKDLRKDALKNHNQIDLAHSNFLIRYRELLSHNDFLTNQSQRLREFYRYMAREYPFLAFTFKGRIKSLIRTEEKYNAYIIECIYQYHIKYGKYPSAAEIKEWIKHFRDLIAYRIVVSLPKCAVEKEMDRSSMELEYLYEIANMLPQYLEEREFSAELSKLDQQSGSPLLHEDVKPYYRDYIDRPKEEGYRSLHIAFYDNNARCYIEVQIRNQEMDDFAEIGTGNHEVYEQYQQDIRVQREAVPLGENQYFDDAYERLSSLQRLELADLDVNLFSAINNHIMNDSCGLMRGRLILPYEHLSRSQTDKQEAEE